MTKYKNSFLKFAMSKKPTAVDLFSGCGGLTQGLKDAGFKVVGAVEIDEKALETYKLNHPRVPIAGRDIREVTAEKILTLGRLSRGELDLLAGCPPCQGFSSIRRRNRPKAIADSRNNLIEHFERLALCLYPKLLMLENVPKLVTYGKFKSFVKNLRLAGYMVAIEILDVAE